MKYSLIAIMFVCCLNSGCSQNFGPGYSFELFKNTPNWDLAKAVQNENENEIRKLIKEKGVDINLQEPKFGNTLLLLAIGNDKLISTRVLLEEGANINIPNSDMNKPIHQATKFIALKTNSFQIIKLL
ncbi:MAG: ankyrin repeat domain-containing protein, partial [Ginsengibacter sp.]